MARLLRVELYNESERRYSESGEIFEMTLAELQQLNKECAQESSAWRYRVARKDSK